MSAIPLTALSTNRHPPPDPPAPSLQLSQTPSVPAASTDRPPRTLLAPVTAYQAMNTDTFNETGVANNNAQHIPPAVTFAGVPHVDASHSVFHQAGRDIHIYPPANGMCTLLEVIIFYAHVLLLSHICFNDRWGTIWVVPAYAMSQCAFHWAPALSGETTAVFRFTG